MMASQFATGAVEGMGKAQVSALDLLTLTLTLTPEP